MELNLADLLTRAAAVEPHRAAICEATTGRRLTWLQLDDEVEAVTRGLYDAGLVAGVRVALLSRNRIELVAAYLGVLRAGMVAVPVAPDVPVEELRRVLVDAAVRLVVCDETAVGAVRAAVAELHGEHPPRVVTVGERSWEQLVAATTGPAPRRADPEALAALLHTSVASGRPRAAMLTHRALLSNVEQVAGAAQPMLHGNDVVLGVLPLHHSYGLCAVLGQVLRQHARLVLADRLGAEECLDLIEDEAVTVAPVAPSTIAAWLEVPGLHERLGPLRQVLSGSAVLAPDVATEFVDRTGVPLHQGYGLTEGGLVTSSLAGGAAEPGSRSVGRPLPGVSLRLVDDLAGDLDREPEDGDPGRILVRGPQLFSGYWPHGHGGPGDDGWWDTGDLGFLDDAGELHLVDRVADVVVVSGFHVFPVEVELVVAELPQVAEVAVVGVDDEETGEAVVAFVRQADGSETDAIRGAVRAHCEERLARFKVPAAVHLVDDLPRTPTGKVLKARLRELLG